MNESKTQVESGPHSLQQGTSSSEAKEREQIKSDLRKKILSIRQGHATGGYCETEALKAEEKKLHAILSTELEECKAKHGYSTDPKHKHPEIRKLELEINGLAFKPRLIAAE